MPFLDFNGGSPIVIFNDSGHVSARVDGLGAAVGRKKIGAMTGATLDVR